MTELPKSLWIGFDGRDYHPVFKTAQAAKDHGWNDADLASAPEFVRLDAITPQQAAKVLLEAYDNFMSGGPETETSKAVSLAGCFGGAAHEMGAGGQAVHALTRSFLIALIDPADEQLDYLRADPRSGAVAREASASLRAIAEQKQDT